jgi:hypothetical protein
VNRFLGLIGKEATSTPDEVISSRRRSEAETLVWAISHPDQSEDGDSLMTILDLLYQEYCRARLAEMRQQLLLRSPRKAQPHDDDHAECNALSDDRAARPDEDRVHG